MSVLKANSSDICKHSKLSKKEEVNSCLRKKKIALESAIQSEKKKKPEP